MEALLTDAIEHDPDVAFFLGKLVGSIIFYSHPLAEENSLAARIELKARLGDELFRLVLDNLESLVSGMEAAIESGAVVLPTMH